MLRKTSKCVRHGSKQLSRLLTSQVRNFASVTDAGSFPKPGEQLHGFTLKRVKHVPELELTALHLEHDKTGAEYLHVARDDSNNVFSIGFKTNPPDATGVPHILEHTTLCGSEKYPIRDPFFKMLPRSLSNFMNAMTSSDHTTYPFATTNPQDFKNLMSVYLDATLHPLLKAHDFAQEGWRIGPENPAKAATAEADSADKRLVFKGVVYNEMKGMMSDASYLFYTRFFRHIFPAINDSGGDPQKMTDLTHEQLKTFHVEHYHPSNAKLFTYGNMHFAEHLKEIGSRLEHFDRITTDTEVKSPINLSGGPNYITVQGPHDPLTPEDRQHKTSLTWLLCETSDIVETFSLNVVLSLLTDGYTSPLYKGLIESDLGIDWSPNTGSDTSGKVGMFSVGLTGVRAEDVPRVSEATMRILAETRAKGFEATKVEGILHQLELALKHKTTNFGMGIMNRLQGGWFNGVDPLDSLEWDATVSAFKQKHAEGGFLERLIEKYLLNDKHLVFTMAPSATFSQELENEENARLASKILDTTKNFGSEQKAQEYLEKRELELLEAQNKGQGEDLSCLPTVHVEDIPREQELKEVHDTTADTAKLQWRQAPTNGLTYFRAINVLKDLPQDLRQLIPLFNQAIFRLGTKNQSREQLDDLIKLKTGGISVGYYSGTSPTSLDAIEEGISLSGYALDRNVPDMYSLLLAHTQEIDFDSADAQKLILQLLQSSVSGAVDDIASSGHAYASRYATSGLTPNAQVVEQTGGLTQVKFISDLLGRIQAGEFQSVLERLKTLQRIAVAKNSSFRVALTCGAESSDSNFHSVDSFLRNLPSTSSTSSQSTSQTLGLTSSRRSFFSLPYQVSYTATALRTVPYTHPDSAPLGILAQMLTHNHLHHEIREKGGAYGGGASHRGLGGILGMYSYRDPNPLNTLSVTQNVGRVALEKLGSSWSDRQLEEAKLSVFQGIDAPQSVSQEGMSRFLYGISHEMEQRKREALLDTNTSQLRDVAERYLVQGIEGSRVTVLGEKKEWVKDADWEFKSVMSQKASLEGTQQAVHVEAEKGSQDAAVSGSAAGT